MAKFQSIEVVEDLVVDGKITSKHQEVSLEGHQHTTNDISNIDEYFLNKLQEDSSFTVLNSLQLNGLDSSVYLQNTNPIYWQVNHNLSQPLEFIAPNRDLYIQLTDGILLEKEAHVYLNNRDIVFNKETGEIYFGNNNKIRDFNDIKLMTTSDGSYKYLYIRETNYNSLLTNSIPVFQALKDTITDYDNGFFDETKTVSFKSMNLFETEEESLIVPFFLGKEVPLELRLYAKLNKDNMQYMMLPKKNIAFVFMYGNKEIGLFYIDNLNIPYKYNLPEEFADLNLSDDANCYFVKPSDDFLSTVKSVYLFRPNTFNMKINKYVGFKPERFTNLNGFIRVAALNDSQVDVLDALKTLFYLKEESPEENNNVLANILRSKATTINGIQFHPGDNITIKAEAVGGNADTLNNLNSTNFINRNEVVESDGKIARFDKDGHLIYPDGHSEWVE